MSDIDRAALVVIDVQNDFVHSEGGGARVGYNVAESQARMPAVHRAIEGCRRSEIPVIFVRTEHNPWTDDAAWTTRLGGAVVRERVCAGGSWGAEFYEVKPLPGEPVVTKHRYSAFVSTDLELVLRSLGVGHLGFCGFSANVCVESSLRHGFMLGFKVTLLEDATFASYSQEEMDATVHNVRTYFGDVSTVDDWIAATP
jgi:ureidoacrylate peracid hydrolase